MSSMSSFWSCLSLYIERPNLINKRVIGSRVTNCWSVGEQFELCEHNSMCETVRQMMTHSSLQLIARHFSHHTQYDMSAQSVSRVIASDNKQSLLLIRQLYPKLSLNDLMEHNIDEDIDNDDRHRDRHRDQHDHNYFEAILIDTKSCGALFISEKSSINSHIWESYKVYLNDCNQLDVSLFWCSDASNSWLSQTLLPKLNKWMLTSSERKERTTRDTRPNDYLRSLELISVDQYCQTYNELKKRYARKLIQLWPQNEKTDPIKFVFEDIAIAAYLIVLWSEERLKSGEKNKQSFVDLGCGNGLLVYLLTKEGHRGVGVDVRKRHIWPHFDVDGVQLMEKTFVPSDQHFIDHVLANHDWLIGNHSDELTPWIPYMASKRSDRFNLVRFFLLPCCPYDFNGFKYERQNSQISHYGCYLNYMIKVCDAMGFSTCLDKLRIPSTKRICLIARQRNYDDSDLLAYHQMCAKREQFIATKIVNLIDYKPRDKIETVRNCTQINKSFLENIVNCIALELLKDCDCKLSLASLAKHLTPEMRQQLKHQCGGLQTLIRNHKHIFQVNNGFIHFCFPKIVSDDDSDRDKSRYKTKMCWFFHNHPKGCSLSDQNCRYIH